MRPPSIALVALLVSAGAVAAPAAPETTPSSTQDVLAAAQAVGAPRGVPLSGAPLDAETTRVGALLRCPVCQGVSIADSPAETAVNMLAQVRELLAAGYTEQQIVAYFERSYGEFVRLSPALRGVNWMLWLAPILGLAVGGAILVAYLRRSRSVGPSAAAQSAAAAARVATEPEDPRLAEYVRRVRSLTDAGHPEERRKP